MGPSHSLLNFGTERVSQISERTLAGIKQVSVGTTACPGRMQILLGRNYVNIPAVQIRIAQEQARLACRRSELATYKSQMLRIQAEEARIILGEQ